MGSSSKTGGMAVERVFSVEGQSPFDGVEWEARTAEIRDKDGGHVFRQEGCEFPASWSQLATNVVASKYFYGPQGTPGREASVRELIHRVTRTIADWGKEGGYFASEEDGERFYDELTWLCLHQHGAFNSPVWFNVGLSHVRGVKGAANNWRWSEKEGRAVRCEDAYRWPQASACFPYETRINTTAGLLPIGDIVVGLENGRTFTTYDQEGKPTPIVAGLRKGKRKVVRLEMADGSILLPTFDHVVFIRQDGKLVEKMAGDLEAGKDRLVLSRDVLLGGAAPDLGVYDVTPDVAWVGGLMVANGYSGRPPSATSDIWEVKVNTRAEADRARAVFDKYRIPFTEKEFHWGFTVRGYGAIGRVFWEALGLWNHTHAKIIPEWVMRSGVELAGAFLNGLFGADSHVQKHENGRVSVALSNVSEDVIRKAHLLLRSMGIYGGISGWDDPREDSNRQYCWALRISDQQSVSRFRALVGLTHETKASILHAGRDHNTAVDSRTPDVLVVAKAFGGAHQVFDIQTASETFWAEGLLVHNCFIQGVQDDMESIMDLAKSEAMLFKYGSGTGTDLSTLRSSREKLSGGGSPSGPMSFLKVYDAVAGVIKSGGKTRRAAKMNTLLCDHPDILEFVEAKSKEEAKAHALIREGYPADYNGEAYSSVAFQNANLSVRVTDKFLEAVEADADWSTIGVTTGEPVETMKAGELMDKIAEGTWLCGDPGVQYHDTIQAWHTSPNTAPIACSNPCSEYLYINDSACNLASINLMKFRNEDGTFDVGRFRAACRIFITAQEILVDNASYPTELIAANSHKFRPLGLGYANLGGLLMSLGLPYDSDEGRGIAGAITAIMTGEAYRTSAAHAAHLGPFAGFEVNREPMLRVMAQHQAAIDDIHPSVPDYLKEAAEAAWQAAIYLGERRGYRNSQVSVLAPAGTIGFKMDCDTTGVEPCIALVVYKNLAGGGQLKLTNRLVPLALKSLGYGVEVDYSCNGDPHRFDRAGAIVDYVDRHGTVEGCEELEPDHLSVFDCAFPAIKDGRAIHYTGHLRMMAAVQPFLSGAISKTCNMPESATVAEIRDTYMLGWKLGLKAVAIYRDGSKGSQPLSTKKEESAPADPGLTTVSTAGLGVSEPAPDLPVGAPPARTRLPATRASLTHKFNIQGHEGYVNVGFYPDGRPGELFITMAKEGSTIGGLMDALGLSISLGLQYGVPLPVLVEKFSHARYEPSGFTKNPDIPMAKSLTDYVFRWLGMQFIDGYREVNSPDRDGDRVVVAPRPVLAAPAPAVIADSPASRDDQFARFQSDAPACPTCGSITVRNGSCYRCANCGDSLGCS